MSREDVNGILPSRPNHEKGCVFRYGAVGDDGTDQSCSCPHKDDPSALVPPWPEDEEHTRAWLASFGRAPE